MYGTYHHTIPMPEDTGLPQERTEADRTIRTANVWLPAVVRAHF